MRRSSWQTRAFQRQSCWMEASCSLLLPWAASPLEGQLYRQKVLKRMIQEGDCGVHYVTGACRCVHTPIYLCLSSSMSVQVQVPSSIAPVNTQGQTRARPDQLRAWLWRRACLLDMVGSSIIRTTSSATMSCTVCVAIPSRFGAVG